jgi:hypothetical protein
MILIGFPSPLPSSLQAESSCDFVIASDQRERGNPEGCEDEVRGNLSKIRLLRR